MKKAIEILLHIYLFACIGYLVVFELLAGLLMLSVILICVFVHFYDKCNWHVHDTLNIAQTGCSNVNVCNGVGVKYKFCPYCGRRINKKLLKNRYIRDGPETINSFDEFTEIVKQERQNEPTKRNN